jgi:transcriptional regulator with XRE-family HTH domain
MKPRSKRLIPALARILEQLGENLRLARLRRRYAAETVAQRAGIARATLYRVEQGDPSVSLGNYARVLQVLRLEEDLKRVALDDELGRKLQDADLGVRARAPKRRKSTSTVRDSGQLLTRSSRGE